jgi:urease accessory protein
MKTGARQSTEVYLEKGSSFVYLPHPSVPHENSIFISRNRIYLSEDCQLIWGEVLTCGRKLNGEEFRFAKYHNITEIFINDKLVIRENLLMQPSLTNPSVMGQLEGFTHQASFIFIHEKADCIALSDAVHEYLLLQKEIEFGVSSPAVNGLLVRVLGYKAEQLHDCLKAISKLVSAAPGKKSASTSEALTI